MSKSVVASFVDELSDDEDEHSVVVIDSAGQSREQAVVGATVPMSPVCHRCVVRKNDTHARCTCGQPVSDYYVATDHRELVSSSVDSQNEGSGDVNDQVYKQAVADVLDKLRARGHKVRSIGDNGANGEQRSRQVIVVSPDDEALGEADEPPATRRRDGDDKKSSSSAAVNLGDIDEVLGSSKSLRKFVLQVVKEAEDRAESNDTLLKRELDLESGAFKVFVRSETPSPFDPRRTMSSANSSGSGFLIDAADVPGTEENRTARRQKSAAAATKIPRERAYIVTNGHVVEDAVAIHVASALQPEMRIQVEVAVVCFDLDLALLRIVKQEDWDSQMFKPFSMCTEQEEFVQPFDDVNGGKCGYARLQTVYAVGYPLGAPRVQFTKGNISGFQRISQEPVIQITAPINPGNSGGALIDRESRVLGVTSAGIPQASLIGFVIPIQYVFSLVRVASNTDRYGRIIDLPYLGAKLVHGFAFSTALPDYDPKKEYLSLVVDDASGRLESVRRVRVQKGQQRRTGLFINKIDPISLLTRPVGGDAVIPRVFDQMLEMAGFSLDDNGLVEGETYPRKVSVFDIYRTRPFLRRFTVKFARGDLIYTNEYLFEPRTNRDEYAIRRLRKDEASAFKILPVPRQVILAPLTLNLIDAIKHIRPSTSYYAQKENRTKEQVAVLRDFEGYFYPGDIVTSVDGTSVDSIRQALARAQPLSPGRQPPTLIEAVAQLLISKIGQYVRIDTEGGRSALLYMDRSFLFLLARMNGEPKL